MRGGSGGTVNITAVSAYIVSPQNNVVTVISDGANWQTKVNREAGLVPIGCIIYWYSGQFTGLGGTTDNANFPLSPEFVECNGQTITDVQSPLYSLALPDDNGATGGHQARYLRGATAASLNAGGYFGSDTSTVTITMPIGVGLNGGTTRSSTTTGTVTVVPASMYATIVMRIK
jgi:hypothetical protein